MNTRGGIGTYVGPSTGSRLQVALNVVCDKVIKGLALLHALVQRAARCSNAVLYDALGQDVEEWAQHLQHRAAVGAVLVPLERGFARMEKNDVKELWKMRIRGCKDRVTGYRAHARVEVHLHCQL